MRLREREKQNGSHVGVGFLSRVLSWVSRERDDNAEGGAARMGCCCFWVFLLLEVNEVRVMMMEKRESGCQYGLLLCVFSSLLGEE